MAKSWASKPIFTGIKKQYAYQQTKNAQNLGGYMIAAACLKIPCTIISHQYSSFMNLIKQSRENLAIKLTSSDNVAELAPL